MGIHSEQGVQTIINYKNDSVILAKTNEDGLKMWFTLTLYKLHKGKVKVKFYMRKKTSISKAPTKCNRISNREPHKDRKPNRRIKSRTMVASGMKHERQCIYECQIVGNIRCQ